MKSKNKFIPDQVVPMEERALLSNFPAVLGPVTTFHRFRGAFVLTSTRFFKVQSQINTAIVQFEKNVIRLFNKPGETRAAFVSTVDLGLARLDATMGRLEFSVPWGAGSAGSPTGGVGLSVKTANKTTNPAELAAGGSVAQLMANAINASTTSTALLSNMNQVRGQALGFVPEYIITFGPQGFRDFGLKNT
jgi:hypothetical protein